MDEKKKELETKKEKGKESVHDDEVSAQSPSAEKAPDQLSNQKQGSSGGGGGGGGRGLSIDVNADDTSPHSSPGLSGARGPPSPRNSPRSPSNRKKFKGKKPLFIDTTSRTPSPTEYEGANCPRSPALIPFERKNTRRLSPSRRRSNSSPEPLSLADGGLSLIHI